MKGKTNFIHKKHLHSKLIVGAIAVVIVLGALILASQDSLTGAYHAPGVDPYNSENLTFTPASYSLPIDGVTHRVAGIRVTITPRYRYPLYFKFGADNSTSIFIVTKNLSVNSLLPGSVVYYHTPTSSWRIAQRSTVSISITSGIRSWRFSRIYVNFSLVRCSQCESNPNYQGYNTHFHVIFEPVNVAFPPVPRDMRITFNEYNSYLLLPQNTVEPSPMGRWNIYYDASGVPVDVQSISHDNIGYSDGDVSPPFTSRQGTKLSRVDSASVMFNYLYPATAVR